MSAGNIGVGKYILETDDSRFKSGLADAEKQAGGFGSKLGKTSKIAGAALAGVGVAAVGAAALSVKSFIGFEKQMNEVFTLLPGAGQDAFDDLTSGVKNFSKEFGVLPNETVPALYNALSAGVPKDNVFEFLETSQKAAVGGVTDLTTAVDAISTVTNSFGDDVISATEASDLMFTAVRLGKTTFDEIGGSISNVAPVAASLGVEFGDVTAAIAALTAQGVPTSVATTQIRGALSELGKEGTAVNKTFKEVAGEGFQDFIAGGGNLQDALQVLEQHANDNNLSMIDLFGSIEAGQAALALTGKGTEAFGDALAAMDESAGATEAAYDQMQGGMDQALKKLRAQFEVLKLEVGSRVAPILASFVGFILDRGIPAMQNLAGILSGPLSTAFGLIRDGVLTFAQALSGNWADAEGIHPLHRAMGQVGSVIRGIVIPAFQFLAGPVLDKVREVIGFVRDNWQDFARVLAGPLGVILLLARAIGEDGLVGGLKQLPGIIGDTIAAAGRLAGAIGGALLDAIQGIDWGALAGRVADGLGSLFSGAVNLGQSLFETIRDGIAGVNWGGVARTITGGIVTGFNAVTDFGSRALGWISSQFRSVDWSGIGATVVNGLVAGITAIVDFGSRLVSWISSTLSSVDWMAVGTAIISGIGTALTTAGQG